jgi:dTDP-4-dehydrorhamnose reductase
LNLVISANGLVGQNIFNLLQIDKTKNSLGTCFSRNKKQFQYLNILDLKSTSDFIKKIKPETIYFCSNLAGGVNFCEDNKQLAFDFHVTATLNIVETAKEIDSQLVYFSTDYVYSGEKIEYSETDAPAPINYYGQLKKESERKIEEELEHFLIIRTTNVYDYDIETVTPNYLMNVLQKLKCGDIVEAPTNLFGTPTLASELALGVIDLAQKKCHGIFHLVGPDFVSRYDWALKIAKYFNCDESLVRPVTSINNFPRRPLKVRLLTKKFEKYSAVQFSNIDAGMLKILEKMRTQI